MFCQEVVEGDSSFVFLLSLHLSCAGIAEESPRIFFSLWARILHVPDGRRALHARVGGQCCTKHSNEAERAKPSTGHVDFTEPRYLIQISAPAVDGKSGCCGCQESLGNEPVERLPHGCRLRRLRTRDVTRATRSSSSSENEPRGVTSNASNS